MRPDMTQFPTVEATDGPPLPPALLVERELRRGRWSVAFRWLLIIPQAFVLWLLAVVGGVALLIGWLAALVMGRLPEPIARYLCHVLRYNTRVNAYVLLLTDRYPPFAFLAEDYPVQLDLAPGRLNRLAVLFRVFLAIPAMLVSAFAGVGLGLAGFFIWLWVLVTGRVPGALFDAITAVLRYSMRLTAYTWLVTAAYPGGLLGDPPAAAPVSAMTAAPTAAPTPTAAPAPSEAGAPEAGAPEEAHGATDTLVGPPGSTGWPERPRWAEPPPPPRAPRGWLVLSAAARRLVILFLVLGAVTYVAGGVVQAVVLNNVYSNTTLLSDVTAAHDDLVGQGQQVQQKISACGTDASALRCVQEADRQLADAFEAFAIRLARMEFPGSARTEAADVTEVSRRFAGALRQLGSASSPQEYTQLANGEVSQLGSFFDQRYDALVRKLSA
jgi:hypothetical protein